MKQMRSTKLVRNLIIITSAVILGLCILIAILYFTTDLFKGKKYLFFEKFSEVFEVSALSDYNEKKNNTTYTDSGKFYTNVDIDNEEQTKAANQFNITFNGSVDPNNKNTDQSIAFNYSDSAEAKFPFEYRKLGDVVGLHSDYVGSKFINIDMSNTDALPDELLTAIEYINTAINIEKGTKEINIQKDKENKKILQNYLNVIVKSLNNKQFKSLNKNDLSDLGELDKGYELSISLSDIKGIVVNLLTTLKDDKVVLDKINQYYKDALESSSLYSINPSDIEDLIQKTNELNLSSANLENESLVKIKACKGKNLNLVEFEVGTIKVILSKTHDKDMVEYNLSANLEEKGKETKANMVVKYNGLEAMQNVKEAYSVGATINDNSLQYNIENTVNFTEGVNIEEFTDENSLMLNNLPKETSTDLLQKVEERISQVYQLQMQNLGLKEDQYPLENINPVYVLLGSIGFSTDESDEQISELKEIMEEICDDAKKAVDEAKSSYSDETQISEEELEKISLQELNDMILEYETTLYNYGVNYNDDEISKENPIKRLPAIIEAKGLLKINIDKDLNLKYTELAGSNAIGKKIDPQQVADFNEKLEIYENPGLMGVTLKGLLSIISEENENTSSQCKIEEINFNGEEYEATRENVAFIKGDILTDVKYKVEFEKDEYTGAIYRVVINEN